MKDKSGENLISILQEAQEKNGWLSDEVLEKISEETGIRLAKIIGVVSFYTQFRTKPAGENLCLLCQGTACHVNGSADIEDAIKAHLGVNEGEISADGKFTYSNVACLGCCSLAPAMMISSQTFGKLTRESVVKILDEY
jgi:NADH-quinone oxidoreductase subunit E